MAASKAAFFTKTTAADLPATASVTFVASTEPTDKAFDILVKNRIHSAPVKDAKENKWIGFFGQ